MRNPKPEEFYTHKNGSGETVKVLSVQFNRVTFQRDGFDSPVMMSLAQFSNEYTYTERD